MERKQKRILSKTEVAGMTVNERLFLSGLLDEFDNAKTNNKERARHILRELHVDEPSINTIIQS